MEVYEAPLCSTTGLTCFPGLWLARGGPGEPEVGVADGRVRLPRREQRLRQQQDQRQPERRRRRPREGGEHRRRLKHVVVVVVIVDLT